jgi:hypothetical protein
VDVLKHFIRNWTVISRRERKEQELEDEINPIWRWTFSDWMERGESPEDARRNACRDFGNVLLIKRHHKGCVGAKVDGRHSAGSVLCSARLRKEPEKPTLVSRW